jgi:hypothetical protein
MRGALCFCLLLVGMSFLRAPEQIPVSCVPARNPSYWLPFVNSAYQFYKTSDEKRITVGAEKFTRTSPSLYELGDSLSAAFLKICTPDERAKPQNANICLTLVRISFSDRSKVLEKSDMNPCVTQLVLDYLEQKETSDAILEKRIAYLKRCTKDFTCIGSGDFEAAKTN